MAERAWIGTRARAWWLWIGLIGEGKLSKATCLLLLYFALGKIRRLTDQNISFSRLMQNKEQLNMLIISWLASHYYIFLTKWHNCLALSIFFSTLKSFFTNRGLWNPQLKKSPPDKNAFSKDPLEKTATGLTDEGANMQEKLKVEKQGDVLFCYRLYVMIFEPETCLYVLCKFNA